MWKRKENSERMRQFLNQSTVYKILFNFQQKRKMSDRKSIVDLTQVRYILQYFTTTDTILYRVLRKYQAIEN